jgi:hypothetical protein
LIDRLGDLDDVGPVVLVDNDSAWPPMLDYLDETPHEVVRLETNAGHRAIWERDIRPDLRNAGPFVVTDPDVLPDPECPADTLRHLATLLDRYPRVAKVGLGLHIDDLPEDSARSWDVYDWEQQFWENEIAPAVFSAPVDTTFALYRPGAGPQIEPALRVGAPYMARHLPWYYDSDLPDPEDLFYTVRVRAGSSNWHGDSRPGWLAAQIARRRRIGQGLPDHPLLDPWTVEPDTVPESQFTPWAEPGWESWNPMSAEKEFCDFAGHFSQMIQPRSIVETGVGQGYFTRRLVTARGGLHNCFESDGGLRVALGALEFFAAPSRRLSVAQTPDNQDLADADLVILHSDPRYRIDELSRWRQVGKSGSVVVVPDCGNGHPAGSHHAQLHSLVESIGVPGKFLRNPRGGFVGFHP